MKKWGIATDCNGCRLKSTSVKGKELVQAEAISQAFLHLSQNFLLHFHSLTVTDVIPGQLEFSDGLPHPRCL